MGFLKIRLLTAGESHGPAQSGILEGIPAGLVVSREKAQHEMRRRQLGFGRGGRMKIETDELQITAGLRFGKTIGSPLAFTVINRDFQNWQEAMSVWDQPARNTKVVHRPRPGHADLPGGQKYAEQDMRNILERASARETVIRNAAGAICKQFIAHAGIRVASHVIAIGKVRSGIDSASWAQIESIQNSELLRCADPAAETEMVNAINQAKADKETLGGMIELAAINVPPGLGSHIHWDRRLDGRIAQAMMSIPSAKGVTIGDAFEVSSKFGSEAHDEIFYEAGAGFFRKTDRAGGTEGGITTGQELRIRVALKPLSTLMKPLRSVDVVTHQPQEAVVERSDVCAVPAAGVVGEAMLALVLADALLEKFAGDSMIEFNAALGAYRKTLESY